jgi:hypothetical protein
MMRNQAECFELRQASALRAVHRHASMKLSHQERCDAVSGGKH